MASIATARDRPHDINEWATVSVRRKRRMTRPGDRYRVGFDIGGTFTDFVLLDGGTGRVRAPQVPDHARRTRRQARSTGLEELLATARHRASPTSATSSTAPRWSPTRSSSANGAPLGLLTTRGFRDILEMGTEQRYDIYDLFLRFPEPLVPRALRLEVAERMDRDGRVVVPLDLGAGAPRGAPSWSRPGVEAVAVCFLHAYRNPAHERAVGRHGPARSSRSSPCRSRPRSSPSSGSTSAAPPPAPTPMSSR